MSALVHSRRDWLVGSFFGAITDDVFPFASACVCQQSISTTPVDKDRYMKVGNPQIKGFIKPTPIRVLTNGTQNPGQN